MRRNDGPDGLAERAEADEKPGGDVLDKLAVKLLRQCFVLLDGVEHLWQHRNTDEADAEAENDESEEDKDGLLLELD